MGRKTKLPVVSPELLEAVGNRVIQVREALKLSQSAVAKRVGVTSGKATGRTQISKIENGRSNIRPGILVQVALALSIPHKEIDPRNRLEWCDIEDLKQLALRTRQERQECKRTTKTAATQSKRNQPAEQGEAESQSSTGAALEEVAEKVVEQIESQHIRSIKDLDVLSSAQEIDVRGHMIPFRHFFRIGNAYPFDSWSNSSKTVDYIRQFQRYIHEANTHVGNSLCAFLGEKPLRLCISEYSRAIFSGIDKLSKDVKTNIIFVKRDKKAEVPEEISAALEKLKTSGRHPESILTVEDWLSFLKNVTAKSQKLDYILFGAEAVAPNGEVVFPQIIGDDELNLLTDIAASDSAGTKIVCVAEAYKFLDNCAEVEIEAIENRANYTCLPSRLWSRFITDYGDVMNTSDSIGCLRRKVTQESRRILEATTGSERMCPFSYMNDNRLAGIEWLVTDIDDTITTKDGVIPHFVLQDFEHLEKSGVRVLLVTGRSAGWATALSAYLSGIEAVVCENGLYLARKKELMFLATDDLIALAKQHLDEDSKQISNHFGLKPTTDSRFRILERTFERPNDFDSKRLEEYNSVVSEGIEVIASSMHIHVRPRGWDKDDGVFAAIKNLAPEHSGDAPSLITVGDSANDIPLFDACEEMSIGVENVRKFPSEMKGHYPKYVTVASYANGFHEIVARILEAKRK